MAASPVASWLVPEFDDEVLGGLRYLVRGHFAVAVREADFWVQCGDGGGDFCRGRGAVVRQVGIEVGEDVGEDAGFGGLGRAWAGEGLHFVCRLGVRGFWYCLEAWRDDVDDGC
jgi:hypothetical protein